MNLCISYDHEAPTILDAVLVNGKQVSQITEHLLEINEKTVLKINTLFNNLKDVKPFNSEIIAESIAENYVADDDEELTIICIIAGAKVYDSSTTLQFKTALMMLRYISNLSCMVQDFEKTEYIRHKYKNNPILKSIVTLMTLGVVMGALAADLVAMESLAEDCKSCEPCNCYNKAVLEEELKIMVDKH